MLELSPLVTAASAAGLLDPRLLQVLAVEPEARGRPCPAKLSGRFRKALRSLSITATVWPPSSSATASSRTDPPTAHHDDVHGSHATRRGAGRAQLAPKPSSRALRRPGTVTAPCTRPLKRLLVGRPHRHDRGASTSGCPSPSPWPRSRPTPSRPPPTPPRRSSSSSRWARYQPGRSGWTSWCRSPSWWRCSSPSWWRRTARRSSPIPAAAGPTWSAATTWAGTPSLVAGASLLVDYILTVAVSISAGVAAIVSLPAFRDLAEHRVAAGPGPDRCSSPWPTCGGSRSRASSSPSPPTSTSSASPCSSSTGWAGSFFGDISKVPPPSPGGVRRDAGRRRDLEPVPAAPGLLLRRRGPHRHRGHRRRRARLPQARGQERGRHPDDHGLHPGHPVRGRLGAGPPPRSPTRATTRR